ncbi:hypothetical protein [Natronoarchaeum rubrum]|uniref:hypothetical protein n=1 Tax=Natronoarchaeum rubrum TaxID=755311 RepID=UPI0021138B03|nr:hypothetical protein [Natronoarchaeum rubrum]
MTDTPDSPLPNVIVSAIERYRRLYSAVYVESPWLRGAIGGLSALSGAILAASLTDSLPFRLGIIFCTTFALVFALSALCNHLGRLSAS